MRALWHKLLGLPQEADTLEFEGLFLVRAWPLWLTLIALFAAIAWVAHFYRRDGRSASNLIKSALGAFRIAALGLLLFLIFQPILRSRRTDVTPSTLAILVDDSNSMTLKEQWRTEERKEERVTVLRDPGAADWTRLETAHRILTDPQLRLLERLSEKHQVRLYRFSDDLMPADLPEPGGSMPLFKPRDRVATATRLGNAIEDVAKELQGQPVAGILLLTDGGQNRGEDPLLAAQRSGANGMPVYTLGLGDPVPPRDLSVTSILADEVVRKNDEVVVSVSIRQRGLEGVTVPLTLSLGGRVVKRQSVKLGRTDQKIDLTLSFIPRQVGAFTLKASMPGQKGELSTANNEKLWPLRVVDKKLKILYVEGVPRWEYRFLKNAILRDQTTQLACILVDADPALGGEGNVSIFNFPPTKDALYQYDILILGDVPRGYFNTADLVNIRDFVTERGGSLLTIAGENFLPWEYRGSPLEDVWPVVVPNKRQEIIFSEAFQLALTDEGARTPMMFLKDDADLNRRLWNSLPGMYWCALVDRAKPGARVLATHPTRQSAYGKLPLMAQQQVGEGTSFMSLVDSTWQWRFRVGDLYFYRFWGQVIRSLTPHELPGDNHYTRVTTDRSTYSLGEEVIVRARLLTKQYQPVRLPQVSGEVIQADGRRHALTLESVPGAPGVYTADWLPEEPGAYRVVASGPGGSGTAAHFVVENIDIELERPEQNEALLRRIAEVSGGEYLRLSDLASLPDRIPDRPRETVTRVERDLWSAPLPLLLFVLLITAEWSLRKMKGLL